MITTGGTWPCRARIIAQMSSSTRTTALMAGPSGSGVVIVVAVTGGRVAS